MTPDECERMDALCRGIQEEKNYDKFATMLRELSELIERKHRRRFSEHPVPLAHRDRPSRTVPGVVSKLLTPAYPRQPEKIEISIPVADDLFREIRIENRLTAPDGEVVALKPGSQLAVTFEADLKETTRPPANPAA